MKRTTAFTMIELLVVIAIIAILAAIIFPVFARAKVGAYRSSDITNMNSLRTAIQLYRADNGAYPPQLLGYVNTYSGYPLGLDVIPANELREALYAKRVEAIRTFTPANEKAKMGDVTTAEWPSQDPRALGSAAQVDTNGDGNITPADDVALARQAYGLGTVVQRPNPVGPGMIDARFYNVSGYDSAAVRAPGGALRRELRYALFWSGWGVTSGDPNDDPRQLGYSDPPENTVVTWNSYFRDVDNSGVPLRNKNDIVLFLGGAARPFDSRDLSERSWRVLP
jgi:prepilin-type N-terminal cleavage/methylation domain-containing protein